MEDSLLLDARHDVGEDVCGRGQRGRRGRLAARGEQVALEETRDSHLIKVYLEMTSS